MKHLRGFTLLECLVALAIIAIALAATLRSAGHASDSALQLREHTLASWVAYNRLAELRATEAWPNLGRNEGYAEQAQRRFLWREQIQATPNPLFRRVDIEVFDGNGRISRATATGFVVRPLR